MLSDFFCTNAEIFNFFQKVDFFSLLQKVSLLLAKILPIMSLKQFGRFLFTLQLFFKTYIGSQALVAIRTMIYL